MKKLILSLLVVANFSTANATEVVIDTDKLATLPQLDNIEVVVQHPSPWTPVQPVAYLNYTYTSCARMAFNETIEELGSVILVKIELETQYDCMAVGTPKTYSVQISSDFNFHNVVVLNPIANVRHLHLEPVIRPLPFETH